jgi:hypothetical protein
VYWKEVRKEAWTRTRNEFHSRVRTSIVLSALGFLVACITLHLMGITIPITLIVGFGAALSANLIYLAAKWCAHTIQIPAQQHQAQLSAISERDRQIAELTRGPRSPFRAQILELSMDVSNYNEPDRLAFFFLAEIRNLSGPDTSIHNFQLCFIDNGQVIESSANLINRPLTRGQIHRERFPAIFDRMGRERAARALATGSQWKVLFMDIHDGKHESEIFTKGD